MSVVQFCPAEHKDTANRIAEMYGYGSNNLSVPLEDVNGNPWFGCHAWWMEYALVQIQTLPQEIIDAVPGAETALSAVITSVVRGGSAHDHWESALQANGLKLITLDSGE